MNEPLVQILVPVYNGAEHIRECLEGILKQNYSNWRGVVVNNCSTDATGNIADEYSRRDRRLSARHCKEFLSQSENYNRALGETQKDAEYVKVVEADNCITSDCITRMVELAERDQSVGIVGSYYLWGKELVGGGVDYSKEILSGLEVFRLHFCEERYLFGTPTTLLFRAAALRGEHAWFRPGLFYDDAELCVRLLRKWKFGYVHQVLSFHRRDNNGLLNKFRDFDYVPAYRYFLIEDFGRDYLFGTELNVAHKRCERRYMERLARAALGRKPAAYWEFHENVFKARGSRFHKSRLMLPIVREILDLCLNPKSTIERSLAELRRHKAFTTPVSHS
jgi:glycosyltransferase involved in cell wall biosynthesis